MKPDTALLQHLFSHPSLHDVGEEKFREMIGKYPYFPHLYWWLAAKKRSIQPHRHEFLKPGVYAYSPMRLRQYIYLAKEQTGAPKPLLQPLYTEDYFAYTRTKLPDKLENDKEPTLEKLQSFTGWLRTMKRTGGRTAHTDQENNSFGSQDEDIQEMAEESGRLKEGIYTEAMAEIRADLGQNDKAIAIYEKLILLNPEKKPYFAAKIEALKKQ